MTRDSQSARLWWCPDCGSGPHPSPSEPAREAGLREAASVLVGYADSVEPGTPYAFVRVDELRELEAALSREPAPPAPRNERPLVYGYADGHRPDAGEPVSPAATDRLDVERLAQAILAAKWYSADSIADARIAAGNIAREYDSDDPFPYDDVLRASEPRPQEDRK